MPNRKKVSELQALKDRRSRMREVRDLEERMLLDKLDNTERKLNAGVGKHNKGRLHLSHHKDVRQLQIDVSMHLIISQTYKVECTVTEVAKIYLLLWKKL